MGLVQIEDSELAQLRKERDDALAAQRTASEEAAQKQRDLEAAEAAKATAEAEKKAADEKAEKLEKDALGAELASKRYGALGASFKAKVEAIPSVHASLQEQAKTFTDDGWEARLTEIEALAGIKRDAKPADGDAPEDTTDAIAAAEAAKSGTPTPTFTNEEVAQSLNPGGGQLPTVVSDAARQETVGKLASIFSPPKATA